MIQRSISPQKVRRFQDRCPKCTGCLRRLHNGGSKLDSAGTDSRQFEELMTGKPDGKDSPKLRTASARWGGTYFDKSWIVSSAAPREINRAMACSRNASSRSRERSS